MLIEYLRTVKLIIALWEQARRKTRSKKTKKDKHNIIKVSTKTGTSRNEQILSAYQVWISPSSMT